MSTTVLLLIGKKLLKSLSTADVDPEFVLNYIPETVVFLESPQYSSMETQVCFHLRD